MTSEEPDHHAKTTGPGGRGETRIKLSILAGKTTVAEAARRAKVSEQSVGTWKWQFLEAGRAGLASGKNGPSTREARLEAEVPGVATSLGEAAVELRHVRTPVRTPGQNGSREQSFGSMKYERLFLEEVEDVLDLVAHAEDYRVECNTVRPHEAIAPIRPMEAHTGIADPVVPNSPEPLNLPAAGPGTSAAQYVLGAIWMPYPNSTPQIGSTPERCR